MVASRPAPLVLVALLVACSPVERGFTSSAGSGGSTSTASHMGGGTNTSTGTHAGGGGGAGAGSSSTGGGAGGGISLTQACADYAAAVCQQNETCAPDVLTYTYGDVATCVARYKLFCNVIADAPHTAWTAKQFESCGNALTTLSCPDYLLAPFTGGPAVCHPKAGTIKTGKACIDSGECATAYCKHTAGTDCGVCAAPVDVGGSCNTVFDCKEGLACVGMSGATTCTIAKQEGQACVGDGDCAFGVACQGGLCKKALDEGASCNANTLCDPLQGLYCNTDINECARATYANAGQACGALSPGDGGTPGLVGCTASGRCTNMAGAFFCVGAVADGQPCDLTMGIGCMNPSLCLNGSCTVPSLSDCP